MRKEGLFVTIGVAGLLYFLYKKNNEREDGEDMNGKYFTISELCNSATAKKHGLNNTPNDTQKKNLSMLIRNLLDPIREKYGSPIYVNSGFRTTAVNKLVGGATNSQHLSGQAADLRGAYNTKKEIQDIFAACLEVGNYDQLILEKGNSWWVHISYSSTQKRGQLLFYNGSNYTSITKDNWKNCLA